MEHLSLNAEKTGTKLMLSSLKENLSLMLEEKNKRLENLKIETEAKKKKAQKMLFPSSKEAKKDNDSLENVKKYTMKK